MIEWGSFGNFVWLWVLPVVVGAFWLSSFRKKSQISRFGELELVERLIVSFSPAKRLLKRGLFLFGLLMIVLALAQPHFRKKEIPIERKGIDVMIALDVSNSMLAKDIAPNRLEKAKLELSTLIEKLKGDRIGIVAFAGEAIIQCPLTVDKGAVKLFLSTVNPNLVSYQGTAIGKAVNTALQAFTDKEKESKAIILLTDGEDHGGEVVSAAKSARDAGIRIYTIGIGTPEGSTLPQEYGQEGYKKDTQGQVVFSRLNDALLKDIARATGGIFYRSTRGEIEIEGLVRELSQMKQKSMSKGSTVEYEENYQIFLWIACVCFLVEMALPERKSAA